MQFVKKHWSLIFFGMLLVFILILQIHNFISFPIQKGFDSVNHIAYIDFLKKYHRFPQPYDGFEMWQPPLYYFLAGFFNNIPLVKTMGFFSWLLLIGSAFTFFRKVLKNSELTLLGITMLSSLPVVLYLSPTISNEFFSAGLISTGLIFYYLNKKQFSLTKQIILGILLGISILAKATAWILVTAIIIDIVVEHKKIFQRLSIPLMNCLLIGGWFYIKNLIIFHNPFIASYDFPRKHPLLQQVTSRNFRFFSDLSAFIRFDLFQAHHYSFLGGTYFSWFFDGHNILIPVQSFSKIGDLLIVLSIPIFLMFIYGYVNEWIKIRTSNYRIFLIYPLLLFISYILYNFRLPFFSTVKAVFLISSVIPFVFFILKGMIPLKKYYFYIALYIGIYSLLIIKAFWILPWWYNI